MSVKALPECAAPLGLGSCPKLEQSRDFPPVAGADSASLTAGIIIGDTEIMFGTRCKDCARRLMGESGESAPLPDMHAVPVACRAGGLECGEAPAEDGGEMGAGRAAAPGPRLGSMSAEGRSYQGVPFSGSAAMPLRREEVGVVSGMCVG